MNSQAQACAHYTVSYNGAVGRSVQEKDIAWHAGNWKYNKTSIGIEHGGYIDDPRWFIDSMYRSSAKLAAYCAGSTGCPWTGTTRSRTRITSACTAKAAAGVPNRGSGTGYVVAEVIKSFRK